MKIERKQVLTDVGTVEWVTMQNQDLLVEITSYGAAIYQIEMANRDLLVGPKDINTFLTSKGYYGKTIGRVSGRLVVPSYQIDDQTYKVAPVGAEKTNLHGGVEGFSYKNFEIIDEKVTKQASSVSMKYISADGEEDFPGELTLIVTYTLNIDNELRIDYEAISNQDTLCNITCHPYFNFQEKKTNINNHMLMIKADHYLNIDRDYILNSKDKVKDTPYDFNELSNLGHKISQVLDTPFVGFDHCWLFNQKQNQVELFDSESKIGMRIDTSYPSIVMYTHNLPSPEPLEQFNYDGIHSSIALECQFETGGIHHKHLNQAILRKHKPYHEYITYQFFKKD
ncbi:MAG: hypothetical protein CVV58_02830 [Tenericutes bacterium HGW-Tenericutes-3]|nr:MAG: hypothetical protein CVV58_02830 [Tenericutes bacterium HGW-Tenericutes-3]